MSQRLNEYNSVRGAGDSLTSNPTAQLQIGALVTSGTRLNSTQRIISPAHSSHVYPHLRADNPNNVFSSRQPSTGYQFRIANGSNATNQVIPISYAHNSRSNSNNGNNNQMGPAGDQAEITQRLSNYKTVVQNQPAVNYSQVLSQTSANRVGPAYGTTNDAGEAISVKGHLHELENKLSDILTEIKYHRSQVTIIRGEKETLDTVLNMKIADTKKSVQNDENRVRMDMERARRTQQQETQRLQGQIRTLNTETNTIGQKLLALQRRVVEMEGNVGIDPPK